MNTPSKFFTLLVSCLAFLFASANPAAAESIFPVANAPASFGNDDPYNMGTKFTPTVNGTITRVRVFSGPSESGDHIVRIYRNDTNAVLAGPITWNYGGDNAWITLDIPDVTITANIEYTVAVTTSSGPQRYYPFRGGYFSTAGNNGSYLTYPANAGVFSSPDVTAQPTSSFGSAAYYRDVVFVPDVPVPVVSVTGNGQPVFDGSTNPDPANGTQYGSVTPPSALDQTFTISNTGTANLVLAATPVVVNGAPAGQFTVTSQPSSPIAPGGSSTFIVRFAPTLEGVLNATVAINSNAPTFSFAVQGAAPQTTDTIFPNSTVPVNRGNDAFYELGTVFQATVPGTIGQVRVYSLVEEAGDHIVRIWRNDNNTVVAGPITWNYGGTDGWISLPIPAVPIEPGVNYTISISTSSDHWYSLIQHYFDNGGSNGLSLTYPQGAGVFQDNNPGVRPTQVFRNSGYLRDVVFTPSPTFPVVSVTGNGQPVVNGSTIPDPANGTQFGSVPIPGAQDQVFTITNSGTAPLVLTGVPKVAINGLPTGQFTVTSQPTSPIAPGASSTFTVRFAPVLEGVLNATVVIASNAPQFTFTVQGSAPQTTDTIFASGVVPAAVFNDDPYAMGTIFTPTVPGKVTQVRVFSTAEESGDHLVKLWRNSDNAVLYSTTWNYGGDNAWISLAIPGGVQLEVGVDYTISVSTGDNPAGPGRSYPFTGFYFSNGGSNGLSLNYPQNAGVFSSPDIDARPTIAFHSASYFRDVVFTPTPCLDVPTGTTVTLTTSGTYDCIVIGDGGTLILGGAPPSPTPAPVAANTPSAVQTTPASVPTTTPPTTSDPVLADPIAPTAITPVTEIQGTYRGLFDSAVSGKAKPGLVTLTVNRKSRFTGSLRYEGRSYTLAGRFNVQGSFAGVARRKGFAALGVAMNLDVLSGKVRLTGTIDNGGKTTGFLADRAVFTTKAHPVPQAGRYTLELLPEGTGQPVAASASGSGYGLLRVSPSGAARFVGKLADGTTVSAGTQLSQRALLPLFITPGITAAAEIAEMLSFARSEPAPLP